VTIFVARHAAVAIEGICYGQHEVETRASPDEAAAALLEQLAARDERIDRVVSSPWSRAREPARRLATRLGIPHTIDARWSELAFGEWEGRRYADLEAHDPRFAAWMREFRTAAPPGGERLDDLVARVRAAYEELAATGDRVLVIAHAGSIRALRAVVRAQPFAFDAVRHLEIERL
jgi:alpha-ribazole phosphatase